MGFSFITKNECLSLVTMHINFTEVAKINNHVLDAFFSNLVCVSTATYTGIGNSDITFFS